MVYTKQKHTSVARCIRDGQTGLQESGVMLVDIRTGDEGCVAFGDQDVVCD